MVMEDYTGNNSELDFLCLDLSLDRTGWSIFKDGKMYKYGIIECNESSLRYVERLMCIVDVVRDILADHPVDCVLIEDVHYSKSISTYRNLCELRGVILTTVYEFVGNDVFIFPPTHPRSCFNPNDEKLKDKVAAVEYISSLYPKEQFNYKDHNDICDSIILGLSFMEYKSIVSPKMSKVEKILKEDMRSYLYREHWLNGLTVKQIAKNFKMSPTIILTWFNNTKLPIKTEYQNG
jgi:Holliday junction resolvasome RuvABC endonuclease subunit